MSGIACLLQDGASGCRENDLSSIVWCIAYLQIVGLKRLTVCAVGCWKKKTLDR